MEYAIGEAIGRRCGNCTLCCKVMYITEFAKSMGTWCANCDIGKGCKVYDIRPSECRTFYCGYMQWKELPDYWFPAQSKMVISIEGDGNRLVVMVDPSRPDAWRKEPYYSDIKLFSRNNPPPESQIIVQVGSRSLVIFPDRDVDLGRVEEDEHIITMQTMMPDGKIVTDAVKMKSDDPRLQGHAPGVWHQAPNQAS